MYIYVRLVHTSQRSCAQLYLTRGRPRWRAARAEGGAYLGQRGDRGGVPRADVRVERRRRVERLRAENATLGGGVRCSHASARRRARPRHTRQRSRACTHAWARTCRMSAPAIRAYDDGRAGQSVWINCIPMPTHPCVPVHGCRERKTYSHTRAAAPCRPPAHTGTFVCMGEAATHIPVHGIAEKSYLHVL